jgi:hypothetical protein
MLRWLVVLAVLWAGPVAAQPAVSSFTVVNHAPLAMRELFVTSAGNTHWGQNRLDGRNGNPLSLPPGASYTLKRRADHVCIFDIRAVFADGKAEERRGVNTCATEAVSLGGPGPAVAGVGGKAADDPSVRIFNRSAHAVTEFRATPSGAGGQGPNRLARPLKPDNFAAIALPRDGNCIFDLRVVFDDGKALVRHRANLCRMADLPIP